MASSFGRSVAVAVSVVGQDVLDRELLSYLAKLAVGAVPENGVHDRDQPQDHRTNQNIGAHPHRTYPSGQPVTKITGRTTRLA